MNLMMEEKRIPKDLLDVITFYPVRVQAAIYITLDYVNQGCNALRWLFPLRG